MKTNSLDREESVVDTKTLVVGQEIWIKSGPYYRKGKVDNITSDGVIVQIDSMLDGGKSWPMRFDNVGKSRDGNGTEHGSWHLEFSGDSAPDHKIL